MNKIVFAALFAAACAVPAGSAFAAQTAQQQRMAACSAQNKGKTGQDYKDAQKACLSAKAAPAAAAHAAGADEGLQCRSRQQETGRRGTQEFHERLPQEVLSRAPRP